MNVTEIKSRTVKTYTLTVNDGEVRDQRYSRQGRQYRVSQIEVVKTDGNVAAVTLRGPVLKKDGSDSLNDADERLYGHRDWPEWLHGIIGGLA